MCRRYGYGCFLHRHNPTTPSLQLAYGQMTSTQNEQRDSSSDLNLDLLLQSHLPQQILICSINQPSNYSLQSPLRPTTTMNSLRTIPTRALPFARTRFFSTSPLARKSAVESATDSVKNVDRKISDAAVKAIEKGGSFAPCQSRVSQQQARHQHSPLMTLPFSHSMTKSSAQASPPSPPLHTTRRNSSEVY